MNFYLSHLFVLFYTLWAEMLIHISPKFAIIKTFQQWSSVACRLSQSVSHLWTGWTSIKDTSQPHFHDIIQAICKWNASSAFEGLHYSAICMYVWIWSTHLYCYRWCLNQYYTLEQWHLLVCRKNLCRCMQIFSFLTAGIYNMYVVLLRQLAQGFDSWELFIHITDTYSYKGSEHSCQTHN